MAGVIEPDDTPPAGSYEASVENLSTWSARSENQWKDITRGNARSGYDNAAAGRNSLFGQLSSVAAGLADVVSDLGTVVSGIFDNWFGGGSTGDPLEVGYTIQAIRDAVIEGATVVTVTSNGTRVIPSTITECHAIVIGGGENGQDGSNSLTGSATRTNGGRGGSFKSVPLDVNTVKGQTLTITVGVNGSATTVKLGATTLASAQSGEVGGIAVGVYGYTGTTSIPGDGGKGGYGAASGQDGVNGLDGTASAVAAKGIGGTVSSSSGPRNGTAGGNADPAASVKSGAAGGGGGAGGHTASLAGDAGSGGPGGYPGGGGGGGGCGANGGLAGSGDNGPGGTGGPGIAWLVYK
ncbi:minor tail protein [Gordonia phage Ronaldo]|uniref:Minor tail protein n=3 Tax=Ronaldovirus ronaldo TaxID=2734270 RepID=A0A6B9LAF4_9CAUD|nr:minor tail protein [Gordonia phage Ronaldo]AXN53620.1 hypothetical protein SEA_RONALDO_58 [Gordonia phage Ronaldo]QDH48397.1 minor tail protein [Gordonia phage Ziko]QHB38173.1 minor tail protein [Gordonia phage Volt]